MFDASKFIFANIKEGVVLLDKAGRIMYLNNAAAGMLHCSQGKSEECTGCSLDELGQLMPPGIWKTAVTRKEVLFRSGGYEANLLLSTEVKDSKIILCLERVGRENIRLIQQDDIFAETLDTMTGLAPELRRKAHLLAQEDIAVLIQGESGTGKDLLARAIHLASPRGSGPFVVVDFSSVPATLLESELFGYEPGAFTGARSGGRVGKFELAQGGTVLLDEIGDMPLELQPSLLRVLNDHKVTRIGGRAPKQLDFRLISCSNRNIKELVKDGRFREDLYYRINGAELTLPPLAKRMEHFDKLVGLFFRKHGKQQRVALPEETRARLRQYGWPGNIRELEKVIQYLTVIKPEGQIAPYDLPHHIIHHEADGKLQPLKALMRKHEAAIIVQALGRHGYNVSETAKALKISRRALQLKMKQAGIKKGEAE